MPWHIDEEHEGCPAEKPVAVVRDGDGHVEGCHVDAEAAGEQMAALYASDEESKMFAVKFVSSPRNRFGTHASYGFKGNYAAAWRCHFSQVGGGALTANAAGPIRGTVRRTAMIAAAMKPPCNLPSTDSIEARGGPQSPLKCTYPEKPSDYGLSKWDKPEGEEERAKIKLTCADLAVIKRAALAEVKRRAEDRDKEGKALTDEWGMDEVVPVFEDLYRIALAEDGENKQAALVEIEAWLLDIGMETKAGRVLSARNAERIVSAYAALGKVLEAAGIDVPGIEGAGGQGGKGAVPRWDTTIIEVAPTKEASLEEQARRIRDAWYALYHRRPPMEMAQDMWVREVYEDRVIVECAEGLYAYPYGVDGEGRVEFGEPTKVEMEYSEAVKALRVAYAIKLVDETPEFYVVGGYGHVWGGPELKDLVGDYFTPASDLMPNLVPVKLVFFDHAMGVTPDYFDADARQKSPAAARFDYPIGHAPEDETKVDKIGKWVRAYLDKRKKYVDAVMQLIEQGAQSWSSGAVPHLVKRARDGWLERWPVAEYTSTVSPAEPRHTNISQLAAAYKAAGLEWLLDQAQTRPAEGPQREGERVRALAIERERTRLQKLGVWD